MKKYLLLFLAISSIIISCSKTDTDSFIPYAGNPANDTTWSLHLTENAVANKLFEGLAYAPFIDSFNATGSALFKVNSSLEIAIPAGSIKYTGGSPVLTGKIRTEIRHLSRRGDFIRYIRPTTSFGKLLESSNVFQIKFFKEDEELILQAGKKLFITIKDPNPTNNQLVYVGKTNLQQPFPIGTNPFFNWEQAVDSSFVTTFIHQDSNGVTKGYQLFSGNINWINTQKFIDSTLPKTHITATLPANFTNSNTSIFAVIKDRKIVVKLNGDYASRSFFAPNIPIGSSVILVSLSLIGNQYFLGFKEMTASPNAISIISPSARTKTEINTFLDGL